MFLTDLKEIKNLFQQIIRQNLTDEAYHWLEEKIALIEAEDRSLQLNLTFSSLPRFVSKKPVQTETAGTAKISQLFPGFEIIGWATDQLCRVWLLMHVDANDKESYIKKITGLFNLAEMNEQVALYSALPVLNYPEEWIHRCEEGIRSNIGTVLEAIMYHNPYPAKYLSEGSWNQLVLKAFFTEKDVNKITGIRERANTPLSETLKDYVQERQAAHRSVNPEIYKLIEQ